MSKDDLEKAPFDLGLAFLDRQLLDSEGRRCGKVDDIEFDGAPGEPLRIAELISHKVHVPIEAVEEVEAEITLDRPAGAFGLMRGEERAARLVRRIPGS